MTGMLFISVIFTLMVTPILIVALLSGMLNQQKYYLSLIAAVGLISYSLTAFVLVLGESEYKIPAGECRFIESETKCLTQKDVTESWTHPGMMGGYGPNPFEQIFLVFILLISATVIVCEFLFSVILIAYRNLFKNKCKLNTEQFV
ncbi:MAG: hypothetical protein EON60_11455 [Alphaproteobacteria bacterium]|nr:MAG: hypothetical protein EON60_11455 [Alphaproteobacteria bacterium]